MSGEKRRRPVALSRTELIEMFEGAFGRKDRYDLHEIAAMITALEIKGLLPPNSLETARALRVQRALVR
jgi:hypothetical protein